MSKRSLCFGLVTLTFWLHLSLNAMEKEKQHLLQSQTIIAMPSVVPLGQDAALFQSVEDILSSQLAKNSDNITLEDLWNTRQLNGYSVTSELIQKARLLAQAKNISPSITIEAQDILFLSLLDMKNSKKFEQICFDYMQNACKKDKELNELEAQARDYIYLKYIQNSFIEHTATIKEYVNKINLSHKNIRFLNSFNYKNWLYLTRLNLSHNNIVDPCLQQLFQCKKIEYIDLSYNQIKKISKEDLKTIPVILKKLDLCFNKIKKFPNIALQNKEDLEINLMGNPLNEKALKRIKKAVKITNQYQHAIIRRVFIGLCLAGMWSAGIWAIIEGMRTEKDELWYLSIYSVIRQVSNQRDLYRYRQWNTFLYYKVEQALSNLINKGELTHYLKNRTLDAISGYYNWQDKCFPCSACNQHDDLTDGCGDSFSYSDYRNGKVSLKPCIQYFENLLSPQIQIKEGNDPRNRIYTRTCHDIIPQSRGGFSCRNSPNPNYEIKPLEDFRLNVHYSKYDYTDSGSIAIGIFGSLAATIFLYKLITCFCSRSPLRGYKPCVIYTDPVVIK